MAKGAAAIPDSTAGERFAPPDASQPITDVLVRVAYTEGNAFKGNYGEALRFAISQGSAADRLAACVAGASIALMDAKSKNAGQEALPFIKEGLAAFRDYQKENGSKFPGWVGLELIRLASLTDAAPDLKDLVDKLPSALVPRARLDMLEAKLAKLKTIQPTATVGDIGDAKDIDCALAWEALARHNARLGDHANCDAALAEIAEVLKPFLHIGMALGDQDRQK